MRGRLHRLVFLLVAGLLCWPIGSSIRAQESDLPPGVPALPALSPRTEQGTVSAQPARPPAANEPPLRNPPPAEQEQGPPSQKSPLEQPPPPGGKAENLPPPPLEPGDLRYPINLATALRLSDARPVLVAATNASSWVAEAQLQHAKVLWVPSFNLGYDYIRHDGFGPDLNRGVNVPQGVNALGQNAPGSFGRPLNQNINVVYTGGGLTYMPSAPNYFYQPLPGPPLLPFPQVQFLTDMIFEPLRARQRLNSTRWDIQVGKNDVLLLTAKAYFNVHKYRGQYAGAIEVVQRGRQLLALINEQSRDLVSGIEVDRARNLLADLEQQAVIARQYWRRSSADLTLVLRLDPRAVVEPLEHDHLQITLLDPDRSLDDLIPIGLKNRPELASHQALVQETLVALRREKLRPLLPSILLNGFTTPYELIEAGGYGEGSGGKLNLWSERNDITPQVIWQAYNMGLGNMGIVKEQRARASAAIVALFQMQDSVAADVARAQADLQSAAARTVQAERELVAARINYEGNVDGLKQTRRFGDVLQQIFRPQEVVFALQLLKTAYDHYFAAVAEYNTAQFELFHALGYPARELAFCRRAGEIVPVDTSRPDYLPRVGTGPPPATR